MIENNLYLIKPIVENAVMYKGKSYHKACFVCKGGCGSELGGAEFGMFIIRYNLFIQKSNEFYRYFIKYFNGRMKSNSEG